MTSAYTLTQEPDELVAKKSLKSNLTLSIILGFMVMVLFYHNYRKFGNIFQRSEITYVLTNSVLLLALLYFLIQVFDRRVQLVINKNGIWLRGKGLFTWKQFLQYTVKRVRKRTELNIELQDKTELKIDIHGYNIASDKLTGTFRQYAAQHSVKERDAVKQ